MKLSFNVGVILFMFSFLFGCSSFSLSQDYEKIADKITEKTAKKLKEQKGFSLAGTGGQMMDDIQVKKRFCQKKLKHGLKREIRKKPK